MATFPNLSSGTVAFYPVTETFGWNTGLARFLNDTEQRWMKQPKLVRLQIVWNNLNYSDYNTILGVFLALKGGFDSTLSIPLGATTYDNMCFTEDQLSIVEAKPGYFSITANFRQVHA